MQVPDVNTLAVKAKTDRAAMLSLWEATKRLIAFWALRHPKPDGTRLYDVDDLIQSGALALFDAVRAYNPERGKFTNLLHYYIRVRFAEVSGYRGEKQRPELYTLSLDCAIADDADITLGDMLEGPDSDFTDGITERIADCQSAAALRAEVEKLAERPRKVLLSVLWQHRTLRETADDMGISVARVGQLKAQALHKLRNTKTARRIAKEYCYRRVSLTQFKVDHTSIQERYMIFLEELEERLNNDYNSL